MIDPVFEWCAWLLYVLADLFGMSYRAVNVWIFVVVWPLVTLGLVTALVVQRRTIRQLKEPQV